MQENIKKTIDGIVDKWNGLTTKQKGYIIAIAAVLIVCLILAVFLATKTTWKRLNQDPLSLTNVYALKDELDNQSIKNRISNSETYIEVDEKQFDAAKRIVVESGVIDEGFTFSDALDSMGMGTTSEVKRQIMMQNKKSEMETALRAYNYIEKANVTLYMPNDTNFHLNAKDEPRAGVILTTKTDLTQEQVESVLKYVKTSVKGLERKNIEITDNKGNVLFSGEDNADGSVSANYRLEVEKRQNIENKAENALQLPNFDSVEADASIVLDLDKKIENYEEYQSPFGIDQSKGPILQQNASESSATNSGNANEPGLTNNGGAVTQYQTGTNSGSEAKSSDTSTQYGINKKTGTIEQTSGKVDFENSSITVKMLRSRYYREEELEIAGTIGGDTGVTWEQYKDNIMNQNLTGIAIDQQWIVAVSNATGIPQNNITILAYENPQFVDKSPTAAPPISTYAMLGTLVLLIALLALGLIRKTAPAEITELEPELSVQAVLENYNKTQEYVSPIDYDAESEVKSQIEKFVDERPEAVAQLLRNWLSSDWE